MGVDAREAAIVRQGVRRSATAPFLEQMELRRVAIRHAQLHTRTQASLEVPVRTRCWSIRAHFTKFGIASRRSSTIFLTRSG